MRDGQLEGLAIVSRFPVAFRLSAFRFSVIRYPPRNWALLTVGLPKRQRRVGPRRGYRVPHERAATGVGALYTPGTAVLIPAGGSCSAGACRSTAASPSTLLQHPICRGPLDEASTRVHGIHPSGLPLACGRPDGTSRRFGFPLMLPHPADQEPTTHVKGGDRPSSTDLKLHAQHHIRLILQSCSSLTACDVASQRQRCASRCGPR